MLTHPRKKILKYVESDIEQIESVSEYTTDEGRNIVYLVKVKGENRPVLIPSEQLQQIAPQKIIKYFEKKYSLVSDQDILKMINNIEICLEEETTEKPKTTKGPRKSIEKPLVEILDVTKSSGRITYSVKYEGETRISFITESQVLEHYPQQAIDFFLKACPIDEAEGPEKEKLIREWGTEP